MKRKSVATYGTTGRSPCWEALLGDLRLSGVVII
jgi:hypothetical protein